jgi:hypothetical protein
MHFQIPHNMSASKAKGRVNMMLNQHRGQIMQQAKIIKEEWQGDTLVFEVEIQGKKVTGSLDITDTDYVFDATLPLMWRLFEGKIEKEIAKQVAALGGR